MKCWFVPYWCFFPILANWNPSMHLHHMSIKMEIPGVGGTQKALEMVRRRARFIWKDILRETDEKWKDGKCCIAFQVSGFKFIIAIWIVKKITVEIKYRFLQDQVKQKEYKSNIKASIQIIIASSVCSKWSENAWMVCIWQSKDIVNCEVLPNIKYTVPSAE